MQIGWTYVDELRRGIAIGHCLRHDSSGVCMCLKELRDCCLAESLLKRLAIARCGEWKNGDAGTNVCVFL